MPPRNFSFRARGSNEKGEARKPRCEIPRERLCGSGFHRIEREGFSRAIESRYVLVGTMNPDEGDLRPQLADRFAHAVPVDTQWT